MADSLNQFFNEAGRQLSDALGNPRAETRPILTGGNPWPHSSYGSGPIGFYPIPNWSLFLDVPFRNNRVIDKGSQSLIENRVHSSKDYSRQQSPGFTPIQYYKVVSPSWSGADPEKRLRVFNANSSIRTTYGAWSVQGGDNNNNSGSYVRVDDNRQSQFRFSQDTEGRTMFTLQNYKTSPITINEIGVSSLIDSVDEGEYISGHDKEDPVYFGFDIKIKTLNSALFTESQKFFDSIISQETTSRQLILQEFKKELTRYFPLDVSPDQFRNIDSSLFGTGVYNKHYYIQKITGLDRLNETNTLDKTNAFVKYGQDKLTITFLEDTTLNIGTLYSLYKSLYWSRLRGKSMIPENLLRFDIEITISEVRNMVMVRRAISDLGNGTSGTKRKYALEILKSNISRYVYDVYECQLFMDKPPHDSDINLGEKPNMYTGWSVDLNYKYSNMRYERFNPGGNVWQIIDNKEGGDGSSLTGQITSTDMNSRYNIEKVVDQQVFLGKDTLNNTGQLGELERNSINGNNIYNYPHPVLPIQSTPSKKTSATERFLSSLKTAALQEAQRQLNIRFRMLNNSLDRIRNAYGIGRIPAPTNVYQIPPGGQFFFDVQNSLRNFGGDVLLNIIK